MSLPMCFMLLCAGHDQQLRHNAMVDWPYASELFADPTPSLIPALYIDRLRDQLCCGPHDAVSK